jgi:omega-6 fatty acid desaturase (delta-12 desaturase)
MKQALELVHAAGAFAVEDRARSWRLLLSTVALQVGALIATAWAPVWLKPLGSLLIALIMVRLFIFVHDAGHDAIFDGSPLGRAAIFAIGVYTLTPPGAWREVHDLHHVTNGQPLGLPFGQYRPPQMLFRHTDVHTWNQIGRWDRLRYRFLRSPLLILFGWLVFFAFGSCIMPFSRAPRKHWTGPVVLALNTTGMVLVGILLGVSSMFWLVVLPTVVCAWIGVYMFMAQHRFPDAAPAGTPDQADLLEGALHSSSFFEMSPVMHWFTGNIGYHHVHHLNEKIPFYRLPEAMAAIPELHQPLRTSFRLADMLGVFRSHLWDPDAQRMVSFREAASR